MVARTGIYRDPAAERAAAERAAAGSLLVGRPVLGPAVPAVGGLTGFNQMTPYRQGATAVNTTGQAGGIRPGTTYQPSGVQGGRGTAVNTVGQPASPLRPGYSPALGGALAGGGFFEGGDFTIDVGGNPQLMRPGTPAVNAPTGDLASQLAKVDYNELGKLMDVITPGWRPGGTGGSSGGNITAPGFRTPGETPTPAPAQNPLLDALAKLIAEEEARIKGAGTALQTALTGRDPMTTYQWNPATVNIPQATLANYVQAVGGSPAEVTATQQLGQELLNQSLADVGQFAAGTQAAEAAWRGRQQDVGSQLQADALRQLGLNRLAVEMGIRMSEEDRKRQQEQQALQLALQYGKAKASGSNLGITVPNIPFDTVTIPGLGNVYIPSTLGGINF